MADELGMVFDTVRDIAGTAGDVMSTLQTGMDICDGAAAALTAASAIPGAAAITGPILGIYTPMRPTLGNVIEIGNAVCQYMKIAIQVMDAADSLIEGDFEGFASEAVGLAQQAMAD